MPPSWNGEVVPEGGVPPLVPLPGEPSERPMHFQADPSLEQNTPGAVETADCHGSGLPDCGWYFSISLAMALCVP
jgi:hypothetical protein